MLDLNEQIRHRIEQINRGEVPAGYKKVLDGIVPCDYKETTFGELFDFYGGLGIPRDGLSDEGIPYLHYGDMHRNTFTRVSYNQYSELPKYDTKLNGNENYLLNDGDVVFLDASEDLEGTSRCVMVENPENKPFISGLHTFIAKSKSKELVNNYKQFITMPQYVKKQFVQLSSGFKVYGMNRNSIKGILFAHPKGETEQSKIVEVLKEWDEAVSLQEKLIQKLDVQKRALMQKLLAPKDDWEKAKLADLCTTYGGLSGKTKDDFGKGKPYIPYMNIFSNCIIDTECFEYVIVKNDESQNKVKYGDILFTTSSETPDEVGMSSVLLAHVKDLYLNSFCFGMRLVDFNKLLPVFAAYYFRGNYFRNILNTLAQGATRFNLSKNTLLKCNIFLPTLPQQAYVAEILSAADLEIGLQKQKLTMLKQQKKSILQLLLNGIVRVSV